MWPTPLAPFGCRGGVAVPLNPVWPRKGVASPGPGVAIVGAWPVLSASCGRRGGVAGPLGRHGGVCGPSKLMWLPWGRGWSSGPRVAAVLAWLVSWAQCGRCVNVAGPLDFVWPL